jgi:hypothetical protein
LLQALRGFYNNKTPAVTIVLLEPPSEGKLDPLNQICTLIIPCFLVNMFHHEEVKISAHLQNLTVGKLMIVFVFTGEWYAASMP